MLEPTCKLAPGEALDLGRLKSIGQLLEELGELRARRVALGQTLEPLHAGILKQRPHLAVHLVGVHKILFELLHEQAEGPVARVEPHRLLHVYLHSVGIAVVADGTEGLLRSEQAVRAAERLNQMLIAQLLVQVKRVDPL